MKAELVKRQDRWDLYAEDGSKIASTLPNPMNKLSLKNCQAIENGYDLDELAKGYAKKADEISKSYGVNRFQGDNNATPFKDGFQKALEILGDKKFSENKLLLDFVYFLNDRHFNKYIVNTDEVDLYLESLQQTEWDVEIEMEQDCLVPKLDIDDCLILKRL